PQHAHEGAQQNGGLQEADAEIGGKLGEMTGVLVHALIRIDADRSCAGKPERAVLQHPQLDEISSQSLAQLELEHFSNPALRDVESKQRTRDDDEHAELHEELLEVAT